MTGFDTDVLIVGGGLAGLALADHLHRAGRSFALVEARTRWGGRVLTQDQNGYGLDLGPSWIWPGQPRAAALVKRFDLQLFDQFATGKHIYENPSGLVRAMGGASSMAGSWRLDGGVGAMVSALVQSLPADALHLGMPVVALDADKGAQTENGDWITAQTYVLALPPRLADRLNVTPPWSDETRAAMQDVPTWMAGQAKFVATYSQPFWRQEGWSGDAVSHVGPLVEIHDASPSGSATGALFGFVGVPPAARRGHGAALVEAAIAQLVRLFGAKAGAPISVHLVDWADQPFSATPLDLVPPPGHPPYGLPPALARLWDGRLHMGSTECAAQFGGFLEGALERAETLALGLQTSTAQS